MKSLRRYDIRDRYYFITSVTHERNKILLSDIDIFWDCWPDIHLEAWVIMPDHFHALIKIENISISKIMHKFKITYSRRYRDKYKISGKIWQNRFWDHIIRDQEDMNKHLDYIHYNPVKHGLINDPFKYQHSSLNRYFAEGLYDRNWGVIDLSEIDGEFGE